MEKEERMSKHTPTPWTYIKETNEIESYTVQDITGDPVVICEMSDHRKEGNAEFIVLAVNERASLLKERDALYDLVMEVAGDLKWIAEPSNMIVPVVVRKKARASLMSIDAFIKKHEEPNA